MGGFSFKKIFNAIRGKGFSTGLITGHLPLDEEKWGAGQFLNAQAISLYVNRAIAKRAEKVGEIEWLLKDLKDKEIKKDPILDLLYRPNNLFTAREFWKLYQIYYDCVGEVYIWKETGQPELFKSSKIIGLHLLMPTAVKPKFNQDGTPRVFEYSTKNGTTEYPPEEIIYIHNPDPQNPLRGQSLLRAGVNAIQTEKQISTYHSRVLANGGKVEGVFKFNTGPLTEMQLQEAKQRYEKEYASAKRAGRPLFLGGDANYVRTGLTPDELSFLEAKRTTLDDISILTGVPKPVLGSYDEIKYSNADVAVRMFLRETINPLLKTLTTELDEKLFPDSQNLSYVDPTPENVDEKLKEIESGVKNSYRTINETREMAGEDPVKGGDVVLVPFNLVPLGTGRDDSEKAQKRKDAKWHPNQDPDVREMWGKLQVKRMDAREKKFDNVLKEYLAEQEKRLIASVQPDKQRIFRKKGLFDEVINLELEINVGKEMFLPVLSDLLKEAGEDGMELAGSDYEFNLSADINSWLDNRTNVFMRQINETTFETLRDQFSESFAEGESRDQLVERIQDTYGDISKKRAGTIARTEVHNATQYGTMQGYKQAGLNIKVWVAVLDSRTRDSHASIDGEERPIDAAFSNGLMFPGDPDGPPEEVINCRCVV